MNILITGATGLIGRRLTEKLLLLGFNITIFTRNPVIAGKKFADRVAYWSTLDDKSSLDGFDSVINLAGEPIIGKRWSNERKNLLCQSRWQITERLAHLINASQHPPALFISASAMGYYGDQGQSIVTEDETPHPEFTHQICQRWEQLALAAESEKTRVCLCRTGIVLASEGGALAKMLPTFRLGLGGTVGHGKQYVPWIHIDDVTAAITHLLQTPNVQGPFNLVAPYPVNNARFSATLAMVLKRPTLLPIPTSAIRLALGEAAALLLGGQRGSAQKLEKSGFHFQFCELEEALTDLLSPTLFPAK